jgi:hypothetical protein
VYPRRSGGAPAWVDRDAFAQAVRDADTRAGLLIVARAAFERALPAPERSTDLNDAVGEARVNTLGDWGYAA